MIRRKSTGQVRRGTTALEAAVVYPVAMLVLVGTIVVGVGVFDYQQLQFLAREGARYASVHGPTYASVNNEPMATTSTVLAQVQEMSVGLSGLNCSAVTFSSSAMPCTVSVTLTYTWTPGAFFGPISWAVTSTMPVTY